MKASSVEPKSIVSATSTTLSWNINWKPAMTINQWYNINSPKLDAFEGKWKGMVPTKVAVTKPPTGVDVAVLQKAGLASVATPSDLVVQDNA
jgi:hypothetical protein